MSKLHLSTPGASVLGVATHVDTVEAKDVEEQGLWVQSSMKRHVWALAQSHPAGKVLKVLNDGKSMNVGSPKGFGIAGLKDMLVHHAKGLWVWGHPLSEPFRALANDLHMEKSRSHAVELTFKEFKGYAVSAGYEFGEPLRLALRLMHDLYYIRYWGDVEEAWFASDTLGLKWTNIGNTRPDQGRELEHSLLADALLRQADLVLTQDEWDGFGIKDLRLDTFVKSAGVYYTPCAYKEVAARDGLLNNVYIDIEWCAGAFRGLIRHERDALLKYFGGRVASHKSSGDASLFSLSKRLLVEGILHVGLMPYIWPQEPKSNHFWTSMRNGAFGKAEQALWPEAQGNVANAPEDYMQIQNVMVRFGVMTKVSAEEFFVPYMKANTHRRTLDARAVAYNDCPYKHKFIYKGTPEHFFWRLSVSLAATFDHNQIGVAFSAHYHRGQKVFLSFANDSQEHAITLRSTHRRSVERIKDCIAQLEAKYPVHIYICLCI